MLSSPDRLLDIINQRPTMTPLAASTSRTMCRQASQTTRPLYLDLADPGPASTTVNDPPSSKRTPPTISSSSFTASTGKKKIILRLNLSTSPLQAPKLQAAQHTNPHSATSSSSDGTLTSTSCATKDPSRAWTIRCLPSTDRLPGGLDEYMSQTELEMMRKKGYTRTMLVKRAVARKLEMEG